MNNSKEPDIEIELLAAAGQLLLHFAKEAEESGRIDAARQMYLMAIMKGLVVRHMKEHQGITESAFERIAMSDPEDLYELFCRDECDANNSCNHEVIRPMARGVDLKRFLGKDFMRREIQ